MTYNVRALSNISRKLPRPRINFVFLFGQGSNPDEAFLFLFLYSKVKNIHLNFSDTKLNKGNRDKQRSCSLNFPQKFPYLSGRVVKPH